MHTLVIRHPKRFLFFLTALGFALSVAAEAADFSFEVRPLLSAKCFGCHGPDENHRKGDLRLDTREGIFGDAASFGKIVEGGSAEDSELFYRITTDDPDERMPPPDSGEQLSADEIALVQEWIDAGAQWSDHWAFVPPTRPELPKVQDASWPVNGIDHFILARLEAEGLRPSPSADKATLVRRVSLDLTGLPPSWEEVRAFTEDDSPDAYEKMVDRMLASPRYGERWARVWLDLARYSDTKGYEKDLTRTIWRYRDYVIDAFNRDLPYDQFTREQLAGDLLPNPTMDQRLATAFHRNTMTNDEGGTDNEEFRVYAVRDRIDTTMQVWMGLTMGCAKCHSHKYDPISIEEYYSFFAFFNQTADADLVSDSPRMPAPTAEQTAKIEKLESRVDGFQRVLDALASSPEMKDETAVWEEHYHNIAPWTTLKPVSAVSESGATLEIRDDASVFASGDIPDTDTYVVRVEPGASMIEAVRLEALADPALPGGGPGRQEEGAFILSRVTAFLIEGEKQTPLPFESISVDHSQEPYKPEVLIADELDPESGWAIRPEFGKDHYADFILAEPVRVPSGAQIEIRLEQKFFVQKYLLGRFRLSISPDARTPERSAVPDALRHILNTDKNDRTTSDQFALRMYVSRQLAEIGAPIREEIENLRAAIEEVPIPEIPIMQELPEDKRRTTHIQERGNFLDLGKEVAPEVPEHFHAFPEDAPRNRLGVAQWLMDPDNPLTARVAVNRHWAQFFGRGIVETEEDFGSQGMLPTHPELLDWLAVEFMESGWSFKTLCKTIVMSAAYRQSSSLTPELLQRDPDNRLLARGPRFRLDAETVRDNALAVAGLLSDKMFGPSVMPPQPEGIWRTTYNETVWETSPGEDRYRRGLYTFHKRTSPYPSMLTFDAPTREWCAVRRFRTNTPLQALVTLNDPVYVEAAQAFARGLLTEGGETAGDRIRYAFRRAVARDPQPFEVSELKKLYERRYGFYISHPEEAEAMSTDPLGPLPPGMIPAEAAAWTAVCNVILNLDETLTKG